MTTKTTKQFQNNCKKAGEITSKKYSNHKLFSYMYVG